MDRLSVFLRERAAQTLVWGSNDCGLFMADWVKIVTGIDPAAAWRGKYSSPYDLAKIGGLETLALAGAMKAGLERTTHPERGDVGLVNMPWGLTGAIKTEDGWAMLCKEGLVITRAAKFRMAWRV